MMSNSFTPGFSGVQSPLGDEVIFHHIAIITDDLSSSIAAHGLLGFQASAQQVDEFDGVNIVFLTNAQGVCIELIAPRDSNSRVFKYLQKHGIGPYHLCYSVRDLEKSIQNLRSQGFTKITNSRSAPALEGRRIVFMFHEKAGLVELLEVER